MREDRVKRGQIEEYSHHERVFTIGGTRGQTRGGGETGIRRALEFEGPWRTLGWLLGRDSPGIAPKKES